MENIRYILHLGDIHIKGNGDRYEEYDNVFENIRKKLNKKRFKKRIMEGMVCCVCGDIMDKTSNKGTSIELLTKLLKIISEKMDVIIIGGNHDYDIRGKDYIRDELRIHVENISKMNDIKKNIIYCDKTGDYPYGENIVFRVKSLLDDDEISLKNDPEKTTIGLFHGPLSGSILDNGEKIREGKNVRDFIGCDYALLGDIHKKQFMKNGRIGYCGSLIQQNYGESISKGLLIWDIKEDKKIFISGLNDRGLLKCRYVGGKLKYEKIPKYPKNLEVRMMVSNKDLYEKSELKKKLENELNCNIRKFDIIKESIYDEKVKNLENEIDKLDVEKIIINNTNDKDVLDLYKKENNKLDVNRIKKENDEMELKIMEMEWKNITNYNEGKVVFKKGIIGIIGNNGSGKTSIIRMIEECFTMRNLKGLKNIKCEEGNIVIKFEKCGEKYILEAKIKDRVILNFTEKGIRIRGNKIIKEKIKELTKNVYSTMTKNIIKGEEENYMKKLVNEYIEGCIDMENIKNHEKISKKGLLCIEKEINISREFVEKKEKLMENLEKIETKYNEKKYGRLCDILENDKKEKNILKSKIKDDVDKNLNDLEYIINDQEIKKELISKNKNIKETIIRKIKENEEMLKILKTSTNKLKTEKDEIEKKYDIINGENIKNKEDQSKINIKNDMKKNKIKKLEHRNLEMLKKIADKPQILEEIEKISKNITNIVDMENKIELLKEYIKLYEERRKYEELIKRLDKKYIDIKERIIDKECEYCINNSRNDVKNILIDLNNNKKMMVNISEKLENVLNNTNLEVDTDDETEYKNLKKKYEILTKQVYDIKESEERLKNLRRELFEKTLCEEKISKNKKKINDHKTNIISTNELDEKISNLDKEIKKMLENKKEIKHNIDLNKRKMEKLEIEIRIKNTYMEENSEIIMKKYGENVKTYEENKNKLKKYKQNKLDNDTRKKKLKDIRCKIGKLKIKISKHDKLKSEYTEKILKMRIIKSDIDNENIKLKNLVKERGTWEIYKNIFKDGKIKNDIIERLGKIMEMEINKILNEIDEKRRIIIKVEEISTTGRYKRIKKELRMYINNGMNDVEIEYSSGYEKFLIRTISRIALKKINKYNRMNIIAIDEGFGCIDNENMIKIEKLANILKKYYETVIIISHNDNIKKICEKYINIIINENGTSEIKNNL